MTLIKITSLPMYLFYSLLLYLNRGAKKILEETKERFEYEKDILLKREIPTTYFQSEISEEKLDKKVNETWNNFDDKAEKKSDKRDIILARIIQVTPAILAVIGGIHLIPGVHNPYIKISVVIFMFICGIMFSYISKRQVLSLRADGYEYHLFKIYLEETFPKYLFPVTIRKRDLRGEKETPREKRGSSLNPRSFTDNELLIIFITSLLYLGSSIISIIFAFALKCPTS